MRRILALLKTLVPRRPRLLLAILGPMYRNYEMGVSRNGGFLYFRSDDREIRIAPRHAAYSVDVLREFDYYFSSVVPEVRSDGVAVAHFSRPKLRRVPGLDPAFVFPGLPEGGSTNNAYLRTLKLEGGETFLDLGPYDGLTAYLFASEVGSTGKVIAVEPDPVTFRVVSGNLERVRSKTVGRIEPVQAAIWSERGTVELCSEGNMGATTSSHVRRDHEPVDVEARTLQQLAEEYVVDRVDAVKMDLEGAEYEEIPAAGDFVRRFRPRFIIEVHKNELGVIDTAAIGRAFSGYGYSCRLVTQSAAEAFPLLFAYPPGGKPP